MNKLFQKGEPTGMMSCLWLNRASLSVIVNVQGITVSVLKTDALLSGPYFPSIEGSQIQRRCSHR